MAVLTYKQAYELGVELSTLAGVIQDYREVHWKNISGEQDRQLENAEFALLRQSNELLIQSAVFVMDEAEKSLQEIQNISQKIQKTLKKLENIQTVIDIVTAVVTLGTAVVARDPEAILETLAKLRETADPLQAAEKVKKDPESRP